MRGLEKRRLPSPAMIVGCVALIAALGGTAVALPGKNKVDKNDLKKNVVGTKNLKKNVVTTNKIRSGAVTNKSLADGAVTSGRIADGTVAAVDLNGAARSPRAYAFVQGSNNVDDNRSRGITDAMVVVEGDVFCFFNVGFKPQHVQVTVDRIGANGDVIAQATQQETVGCTGAEDASVRLFDVSLGANDIGPDFYVAFFE